MLQSIKNCWAVLTLIVVVAWQPVRLHAENYAFLVAVQDYDVKDLKPLNYTRSDILEFAKVLEKSGFKSDKMVVMTDKGENRRYFSEAEKIRAEFELLLAGIKEGDTLVVAFSGHGVQFVDDPKNYFCPADADLDDPKHGKLIALSEIYERLKECPAEKKLLLVDACRKEPLSPVKKARLTVNLKSVTRPQTEAVPKGVVAVFSCSAGQESYEWPELKHGVFFYHVLEAWNGAADSGDRKITLSQVINYATDKTQTFARLKLRAPQVPHIKSDFEGTWVLRTLNATNLASKTPDSTPSTTIPPTSSVTLPKPLLPADNHAANQEIENSIKMKLCLIPAGEFQMGSPESEADRNENEKQRLVRIKTPFYLGKYEVTQAEFLAVSKRNPSWFSSSGGGATKVAALDTSRFPVEQVNWFDAVEFCNKLSENEGLAPYYRLQSIERDGRSIRKATASVVGGSGYRLPSESEWEYACRAESETPFHFGSVNNGKDSNVSGIEPYGTSEKGPFLERTTFVGAYGANRFGLHDMHGNVGEWCNDYVHGISGYALRGGSWIVDAKYARSAHRYGKLPSFANFGVGFRVAVGTPSRIQPANSSAAGSVDSRSVKQAIEAVAEAHFLSRQSKPKFNAVVSEESFQNFPANREQLQKEAHSVAKLLKAASAQYRDAADACATISRAASKTEEAKYWSLKSRECQSGSRVMEEYRSILLILDDEKIQDRAAFESRAKLYSGNAAAAQTQSDGYFQQADQIWKRIRSEK